MKEEKTKQPDLDNFIVSTRFLIKEDTSPMIKAYVMRRISGLMREIAQDHSLIYETTYEE